MQTDAHRNILLFLLISIGLICLPHVYHLPPAVFGFFSLLLVWRLAALTKPERLPKGPLLALLTVIGLAILYKQFHSIMGRDAGTSLFLIALGLKLMELNSEREFYLVNYLAFIVAASQFLYEQSILMAAYILAVCGVLLAVLVYLNSLMPNTRLALKKAAVIIAQALPMAIAVFIFFPRVEAPRWMLWNDKHEARMGLSDSMEPGSITDLGMSDELVFRVKFSGALPPPAQRYWRGPVLTHTDGKKWTQARFIPQYDRNELTSSGQPYRYTLLMEPQEKDWVFALEMPAEFSQPLSRNANFQLTTSEDLHKRAEFNLASYLQYHTGGLSKLEQAQARQLPGPPSERIKKLVAQLHGFDAGPEEFIGQLLAHFRQENFHYTLTPPLMEENPIETFLFETRHGFCSHYAAAFVYLMRVAGIPARVVTGYQGGEFNAAGNFLEVRQADAHAWAEVWLENKGWVRFDPTAAIAPERIERGLDTSRLSAGSAISYAAPSEGAQAAFGWLKQARQLWGNIDYNWQRWVINYNSANQTSFMAKFGINDLKTMVYWMMGLVAFITVLLSLTLLYRRPPPLDPAVKAYNRFLKKLAKAGYIKNAGEGPQDFAERIKPKLPQQAGNIDVITAAFIAERYGRTPSDKNSRQLDKQTRNFKTT